MYMNSKVVYTKAKVTSLLAKVAFITGQRSNVGGHGISLYVIIRTHCNNKRVYQFVGQKCQHNARTNILALALTVNCHNLNLDITVVATLIGISVGTPIAAVSNHGTGVVHVDFRLPRRRREIRAVICLVMDWISMRFQSLYL